MPQKALRVKSVHLSCIFNLSLVKSSTSIVLVWSFEIGVKWSYVSGQEQVVIFSPCVVVRKFNVCQMNISCKSNLNIAYNQIQKEKNYLFQNLSTFSKKFTIALKRKMMRLRRSSRWMLQSTLVSMVTKNEEYWGNIWATQQK